MYKTQYKHRPKCISAGGLRWHGLIPFFNRTLRGRAAPDALVIHCGGNDFTKVRSRDLAQWMKTDMRDLHQRFPRMEILFSSINERRSWGYRGIPGRVNNARKWVNKVMARFVESLGGKYISHYRIKYNMPWLFLRDDVHLSPKGNEIFLKNIAQALKG